MKKKKIILEIVTNPDGTRSIKKNLKKITINLPSKKTTVIPKKKGK